MHKGHPATGSEYDADLANAFPVVDGVHRYIQCQATAKPPAVWPLSTGGHFAMKLPERSLGGNLKKTTSSPLSLVQFLSLFFLFFLFFLFVDGIAHQSHSLARRPAVSSQLKNISHSFLAQPAS